MNLRALFVSTWIGMDIQPNGIYFVQIYQGWRRLHVRRLGMVSLNSGIFMEGRVKRWDELREVLVAMVAQYQLQGLPVVLAVPVSAVRFQYLQVPLGLSQQEISEEIAMQFHRDLPGMRELLQIDFSILPKPQIGCADVYVTATHQDYLAQYINCINAAGLAVKIIDVDVYALQRIMAQVLPTEKCDHAILYFTLQQVILISFDHHAVSSCQQCLLTDIDTPEAFEHWLRQASVGIEASKKVYVVGVEQHVYLKHWQNKNKKHYDYVSLTQLPILAEYKIAYGLALRRVPRW